MNRMKHVIDRFLEMFLVLLAVILVLDVVWQVFSRYILNDPSSFTDELARYLMIWLALFGAAYLVGKEEHLAIDLLARKWKSPVLPVLIQSSIVLFSILVLITGGIRLVYITISTDQLSPSLGIPLGYIYLSLPLSGILICIYSGLNLFSLFKSGEWKH